MKQQITDVISLVETMHSWGMQEVAGMCTRYEALAKEMKKKIQVLTSRK